MSVKDKNLATSQGQANQPSLSGVMARARGPSLHGQDNLGT